MKKVIFVDRDGTILCEPADEQVDSYEKMEFVPGAISGLKSIASLDYELVMASNQDGLGTDSFPEDTYWPVQNKMLSILKGEGVEFSDFLVDRSFPEDNAPTRKPGIGMFGKYMDGSYDLASSFVIGDRDTDRQLADALGAGSLNVVDMGWPAIAEAVRMSARTASVERNTAETRISVFVDLDGKGESKVDTGLKFFDHMLDQLPHHGGICLQLGCKGDLEVDEHHTIEDTGIALGQALRQALGDKKGIERYGFALPMDESRALVLLDFGGRSELVWDVEFTREYVGDVPTEMFRHFFKSISDALGANIYVQARGENNHHLAESIFKAFARSLKQAVRRNVFSSELPSSKGLL